MSEADDRILRWNKRERLACQPGDNRIKAKARRKAKKFGSKIQRQEWKK